MYFITSGYEHCFTVYVLISFSFVSCVFMSFDPFTYFGY